MTNKCPHCATENEVDVSGYYLCRTCDKWYSGNDKPKRKTKESTLNKANFLDDEESGIDQKVFKCKHHKRLGEKNG